MLTLSKPLARRYYHPLFYSSCPCQDTAPRLSAFPHQRGYWAKKVRGKLHYFGKIADDPSGQAALQMWLEQRDDLLAGRTPRSTPDDGLTVAELCSHFLTAKEQQRDSGDIRPTTFADYFATCKLVVDSFGKNRLIDDLAADDFQALRLKLARRLGPHALSREVLGIRTLFKYAVDAGLIDKAVRFGPMFKRPEKRIMRAHRQKGRPRMFEATQIRVLLDAADQPLTAMILRMVRQADLFHQQLKELDPGDTGHFDVANAHQPRRRATKMCLENSASTRHAGHCEKVKGRVDSTTTFHNATNLR